MCISAANKPTLVLEMWAAPTVSAVGFLSMSEATEPSLPQFIRYYLLSLCYFILSVKLYCLDVTLTASQCRYVASEERWWSVPEMEFLFVLPPVRGCRPGKIVQMTEAEVRGLCIKSREIFLSQPILLELEAPLKICGQCSNALF